MNLLNFLRRGRGEEDRKADEDRRKLRKEALRLARLGYSPQDIAETLNLPPRTIYRWLEDHREPDPEAELDRVLRQEVARAALMELRTNPELRDLAIRNALGLSRQRHRDPVDELAAAAERLEKVAALFGSERGSDEPWYSGVLREFARGLAPAVAPLIQQAILAQQQAQARAAMPGPNGVMASPLLTAPTPAEPSAPAETPATPSAPTDPRDLAELLALSGPEAATDLLWRALEGHPALAQIRPVLATLDPEQFPTVLGQVREMAPEWSPVIDYLKAQDVVWHSAFLARVRALVSSATQ
jgi:hypothetical protein